MKNSIKLIKGEKYYDSIFKTVVYKWKVVANVFTHEFELIGKGL